MCGSSVQHRRPDVGYDMAGRLVREIGTIENNMEIELPVGVYLIVTDVHRRPLKAAIR